MPVDAGLGFGWTIPFNKRLETWANTVQLRQGDGRGEPFSCINNVCTGDADTNLVLTQDGSGYTLTYRDNATDRYDTTGKLRSETSSTGQTTAYGYDSSGRLSTVTNVFGHTLTFVQDNRNHFTSVADPVGNIIYYDYDDTFPTPVPATPIGNLTRVRFPDSTAKIYYYEDNNNPHSLTGIAYVDASNNTTRFSTYQYYYNSSNTSDPNNGKAIHTEHAQTDNGAPQESFTLAYNSDTQTTVIDPVSMQEVMTFTTNQGVKNLVTKTSSIDTKSLQQTFDANNNLTCRKDEEGHVTTYTYNATNQRTGMTEGLTGNCTSPASVAGVTRTTNYQYLASTLDLPTGITSPSVASGQNKSTTIQYTDTSHPNLPMIISQSGYAPAGATVSRTVTLGYNASGQVNSINGPRTDVSDITTLEYNVCTTGGACGQIKKITNALGQITTYDLYDANGRVTRITDPNGLVTTYTYDPRGRVDTLTQTPPLGGGSTRLTVFTYTPWGAIQTATTPDGVTLTYGYDAAQYLRTITDNLGNRVEYHYDLKGNRDGEDTFDPNGSLVRSVAYASDLRNRLQTIDTAGSITQQVFDAVGNLVSETDPKQNPSTLHTPDALNRLIRTIDRMGGETNYDYDINDRLTQVTAPGNPGNRATTSYKYDDLGNLLQETSPDRGTTSYSYDAAGNVTGTTNARGIATVYGYDALNRLTLIDYPGTGEDISFTYDSGVGCSFGIGRLCRTVDESGATTFAYDGFGNMLQETFTDTAAVVDTTLFSYDQGDRRLSVTTPGGRAFIEDRDAVGRLIAVRDFGSTYLDGITYRADGLLTGGVYGNGLRDVYDYDLQGRLTQSASAPVIPSDGDLNGDGLIDVGDMVILIRIVHELVTPTAEQAIRGDVHPSGAPDGVIDLRDYLRLQRMVLGMVP